MSQIREYIKKLKSIYGDAAEFTERIEDHSELLSVPEVMQEFYKEYSEIRLPFGYIDKAEIAIERSRAEPFKSEGWFCFGFDGYFSFWLCRYQPDEENLSFTCWDHESGSEIDGAVYEDIIEFLEDLRSEYEEDKDE